MDYKLRTAGQFTSMSDGGKQQQKNRVGAKKSLSDFARRFLAEWQELRLPANSECVVVAVSGGADSVALLLALAELIEASRLSLNLTVAHLDHGLRGAAGAADANWVAWLAAELGFKTWLENINVGELAAKAKDNLEQAARRARYKFLQNVAMKRSACVVLTGHTMDDQAETVLLRLLRGSGAEGLSGMKPLRALISGREDVVLLARPLLRWARRIETEMYCGARGVEPRIDEMNADEGFARVRVRRQVVPLLETFNPRAVEAISRASSLLHEDASALNVVAGQLLAQACETCETTEGESFCWPALRVEALRAEVSRAVRRRALRQWIGRGQGSLRRVELVHLVAIEHLLVGKRGGRIAQLPGGAYVERRGGWLRFYATQSDGSGEPKS